MTTPEETTSGSAALSAPDHLAKSHLQISGDKVAQATRDLPDAHRSALRWLYSWAQENSITSMTALADECGISATTLYRVFTATYGAKLDAVVERITQFRRIAQERGAIGSEVFVETSISRKIAKTCDWALISNSVALIYGNRGLGKTFCLEHYLETHNHGMTKLVRMPASAGVQLMMQEFARACHFSHVGPFDKLRDRVISTLDRNNLVIVDELHQVFLSYQRGSAIKCLEVIREIHDRTKCGMVLCGTQKLRDELLLGQHVDVLEQFTDRGVLQVQLTKKLPRKDVFAIAAGFGLDDEPDGTALDVIEEVMLSNSLRRFGKLLQASKRLACKEGKRIAWSHFVRAHDILAKLAQD
jgi:DNA transposition AAA+ family ATPase